MTTVAFIVLAALAVALVAWLAVRKPSRPYEQRHDQDTAWNDPLTPAAPEADKGPDNNTV